MKSAIAINQLLLNREGDPETSADLALIEGKILTMNPKLQCAEAVAVRDGRILKVGTNHAVKAFVGKQTKVIRLNGKTVLPGFIDTHIHVVDFGRLLMWLDLAGVGSIVKMQSLLRERLQKTGVGKWIVGRGWDDSCFAEKRLPNRFDLDAAAPENPVVFYYQCGPVCVVNSKALELACITKTTPNPAGGTIVKAPKTGEPTGILRDTATDLVWSKIPEPTEQELVEAAGLALEKIATAGITSIHWLATSQVDIEILRDLCKAKKLPIRVFMIIPSNLLGSPSVLDGFSDCAARVGGVEVLADGFLSSGTAALFEPYVNDPSVNGKLLCLPAEMGASADKIAKAGLQLVIHAMGDKAIDAALTTIEACKISGRHRVDQAALFNKDLIERVQKKDVVLSVQPIVGESEFSVYSAMAHLGKERARWLYPLKSLFKKGICVCGGSDCPMEPLNPLLAIQSAVARPFFPEEQLNVDEALRMYTVNAAYASSEESVKGSIDEGKLADFTVLSSDPHQVAPTEIQEITVELTVVGGKIVYPP